MRNSGSYIFGAAVILLVSTSHAFYPVDGWWYNPNESGRGFNIEMQDDEMFISAFHYRPNGEPVWWVANGRYNDNTGRMSGEFLELENGQCPGCSYTGFPDIVDGAGSQVTIQFSSPVSATLSWDGESIQLIRQYWRFSLDDLNSFLFGEFHVTPGALGVYFGQQFYLDDIFIGSDGTEYVSGRIRGASNARVALGRFDPNLGLFFVLIDSSTSFYQALIFDMTKDRLEGESEVFDKNEDPTGSGLPFVGHRVSSKAYVQSGTGPHSLSSSTHSESASESVLDLAQAQQFEIAKLLSNHSSLKVSAGVGSQVQASNEVVPSVRSEVLMEMRLQLESQVPNIR